MYLAGFCSGSVEITLHNYYRNSSTTDVVGIEVFNWTEIITAATELTIQWVDICSGWFYFSEKHDTLSKFKLIELTLLISVNQEV